MEITVNGKPIPPAEAMRTLEALLARHDISADTPGVAVAVNDEVVPRQQWNELPLRDGDRVEIIHAVQGG